MPGRSARPCTYQGCNALSRDGTGRCEIHPRQLWTKREDAPKRINGTTLKNLRARLFRDHPLCEECERNGRVMVATQRDHRIPLAEGGTEDESNISALCVPCHMAKSKAEAIRGKR